MYPHPHKSIMPVHRRLLCSGKCNLRARIRAHTSVNAPGCTPKFTTFQWIPILGVEDNNSVNTADTFLEQEDFVSWARGVHCLGAGISKKQTSVTLHNWTLISFEARIRHAHSLLFRWQCAPSNYKYANTGTLNCFSWVIYIFWKWDPQYLAATTETCQPENSVSSCIQYNWSHWTPATMIQNTRGVVLLHFLVRYKMFCWHKSWQPRSVRETSQFVSRCFFETIDTQSKTMTAITHKQRPSRSLSCWVAAAVHKGRSHTAKTPCAEQAHWKKHCNEIPKTFVDHLS